MVVHDMTYNVYTKNDNKEFPRLRLVLVLYRAASLTYLAGVAEDRHP